MSILTNSQAIGPSIDQQADRWRNYVLAQYQQATRDGLNLSFFDDWLLRKCVRVGAPIEVIEHIAPSAQLRANNWEAVRYAIADQHSSIVLPAVLGSTVLEYSRLFVWWAAFARNWTVVRQQLSIIPMDRHDEVAWVLVLMEPPDAAFPRSFPRPALSSAAVKEAIARLEIPALMARILTRDDTDNIPSVDGFDIRNAGQPNNAPEALVMVRWLEPEDPRGRNYVENLGVALAARFSAIQPLGTGEFGAVFSAADRYLDTRVALKISALSNPIMLPDRDRWQAMQDELEINLLIRDDGELSQRVPFQLYVYDWTRGRLDMARLLDSLRPPHTLLSHPFLPGLGVYQVMLMPMFELELSSWLNTDPAPQHRVVVAAMLLGQLLELTRRFGLQHNDLHSENILISNREKEADPLPYIMDVNLAPGRRLRLTLEQTDGVVAAIADFGMASIERPRVIGARRAPHSDNDIENILRLFGMFTPAITDILLPSRNKEQKILDLFDKVPEFSGLVSKM